MRDEFEDDNYVTEDEAPENWRARLAERLSIMFGAVLALIVIVGFAVWGYRLTQREATAVPVIRAALEPAKVQPDDPGGAVIAHQDITSYDAGARDPKPLEIALAPPPERPAAEDVPMGTLQDPASDSAEIGADTGASGDSSAAGTTADAPETDATEQAPEVSPLVRRRPSDLRQRVEAARQAETEEAELASRAAASRVQIQLGAFPDRTTTKAEWDRIYKANEDILRGRALVVQSTISGGRRFFRLRAGPFEDPIEAQNVCRALQARGQDCLVAVNG